jgi:predicted RNA-binding Zn ribbon-like protein
MAKIEYEDLRMFFDGLIDAWESEWKEVSKRGVVTSLTSLLYGVPVEKVVKTGLEKNLAGLARDVTVCHNSACGKLFEQPARGRKKLYCSVRCKDTVFRNRKRDRVLNGDI